MILTILLIILIIAVIGSLPVFPHSRGWGYFPGGILGIVVLVLVILYLTGHLPHSVRF
jgi:hypothetical protein